MALIRCRECGKKISEYAETCPNCGCPQTHRAPEASVLTAEPEELSYTQKKRSKAVSLVLCILFSAIAAAMILFRIATNDSYIWYLVALPFLILAGNCFKSFLQYRATKRSERDK